MSNTRPRCLLRAISTLAVLSAFVGSAAFAQATSVLIGVVRDASTQKPVTDVVVTATSPQMQGEQVVVTDNTGQFFIPQLPPGVYALRFEKESFHPLSRGNIELRAGVTLRADVQLLPEAIQSETIEVVGRPPTIDVGSSATGGSISSDFVKNIAVSRPGGLGGSARGFESIAATLPQASNDAFGVAINGASSPENAYKIDGATVNSVAKAYNASPLSIEFIDEVNVIEGGYMPEYGRTTGGTISAITKSGGNEYHGSIWYTMTPGFMAAAPSRAPNYQSSIMNSKAALWNIGDFGAAVGGYILKDKLWFFAGIQPSYSRYQAQSGYQTLGAVNSSTDLPALQQVGSPLLRFADQREIQYIAKLTFLANQDNRIALTVTGTPRWSGSSSSFGFASTENIAGPLGDFGGQFGAVNTVGTEGSLDVNLKWNSSYLNKKILLDTTLAYHHENVSDLPIDGSGVPNSLSLGSNLANTPEIEFRKGFAAPQTNPARLHPQIGYYTDVPPDVAAACSASLAAGGQGCPQATWFAGGPGFIDQRSGDSVNLDIVATYLMQALGHHVWKAGFDLYMSRYDSNRAYSGGQLYVGSHGQGVFAIDRAYGYLTAPDQLVELAHIDNVTEQSTIGGFVQDSWSVADIFTINAGVRYDAQTIYDNNGNVLMALPNQWSPRVGAVWDPTQAGRSKIFANYSQYYQNVALNIADRGLTGIRLAGEPGYFGAVASSGAACDPKNNPQGCLTNNPGSYPGLSPGATNPSQLYTAYNATRTVLDPNISAPSTNEIVAGAEYEIFTNARLSVAYTRRRLLKAIEDMSNDNANTFFVGNPGFGIANGFPQATRRYDAVTVALTKNFADNWLAQASYTWSQLTGNYDGLFAKQGDGSIQFDPNSNATFDLKEFIPNSDGPLNADVTHVVKLYGAKQFVFGSSGLNIGLGYTGNSGTPTSYIGYDALYNQPLAYLVARGSGPRMPWVNELDGHIGYDFRFSKDNTLSLMVDIFNLFNWQTPVDDDQRYTQAGAATLPIPNGQPSDLNGCTQNPPAATCKIKNWDPGLYNPNFQHPNAFQAPREIRLGARFSF